LKGIGSGRFLSFELDGNQYAVEVERVEVVLETVPITRVPKAPSYLKGVINYRGAVIPVADLRTRFREGLAAGSPGDGPAAPAQTAVQAGPEEGGGSIIVLHLRYSGDDIVIGVIADAVREVVDLDPGRMEKAPGIGGRGGEKLLAGIAEKDGSFIVILDMDEAFNMEDSFAPSPSGRPEERR
jgi:purine-binding chemotaxis protein CheW